MAPNPKDHGKVGFLKVSMSGRAFMVAWHCLSLRGLWRCLSLAPFPPAPQ